MFAIMFFAAGLAAAGLVGSRRSDGVAAAGGGSASPGLADERGITLQTLIVTAVLVLMAVAAGVVIVAITNSSSDDLEESGTDVQARCNEVEIYDPIVASRNELGSQFGVDNSMRDNIYEVKSDRIGCIPVCVWMNDDSSNVLEPGEVKFFRDASESGFRIDNIVRGGASRIYLLASGSDGNIEIHGYGGSPPNPQNPTKLPIPAAQVDSRIERVAVAPNQNECHTYDAGGNVLLGN